MFCWRVTKYNPKNRDKHGIYLKDEWTDYSDIGRSFEGKKFTYEEYETVENKYIQAVLLFMDCLNINALKVTKLIYKGFFKEKALIDGKVIADNKFYDEKMIIFIIRSILRNKFGCKLESNEMYIYFGWDYYMFIGSSKSCESAIQKIEQMGLFVEYDKNPYYPADDIEDD